MRRHPRAVAHLRRLAPHQVGELAQLGVDLLLGDVLLALAQLAVDRLLPLARLRRAAVRYVIIYNNMFILIASTHTQMNDDQ